MIKHTLGWEFTLLLKIALFEERPSAIRSRNSLEKSEREQFGPVALYRKAEKQGSDSLFEKSESLFRSFAH